jgi:hypothetical protein
LRWLAIFPQEVLDACHTRMGGKPGSGGIVEQLKALASALGVPIVPTAPGSPEKKRKGGASEPDASSSPAKKSAGKKSGTEEDGRKNNHKGGCAKREQRTLEEKTK